MLRYNFLKNSRLFHSIFVIRQHFYTFYCYVYDSRMMSYCHYRTVVCT